MEGILNAEQAYDVEEVAAENAILRKALASAREHNRMLEGQVSRLVEENVQMRRELHVAAGALMATAGELKDLAMDCLQCGRERVGGPAVGHEHPGPAALPAAPD